MNKEHNTQGSINYIELPAKDIPAIKAFFTQVFSFEFTDYGPEYSSFSAKSAGLEGGFYQSDLCSSTVNGSALVVFLSHDLGASLSKVEKYGGTIIKPIFEFPGGKRFHFTDPNGNEWAVWSLT
jgi:predicted enzyme related to lactoylglutathione lyase